MHVTIKMMTMLLIIAIAGCGENDKAANPEVFKNQQEALDKAKGVEGMVLDAEEQQLKKIDNESQ